MEGALRVLRLAKTIWPYLAIKHFAHLFTLAENN